jgi:GNAT superfamily N-acetyltransferase
MIEVRPLENGDRGRWEELFRAYMRFYERSEPQALYDRAWNEFMRDERMHALVACIDGEIIGIVHFLIHANTSAADVCYLQDLFTAEAARRRGVGRRLIEAVAARARERECSRLYWMTQESNTAARALYDCVAEYRGFIRYQMQL